ncbi:unnamed protein product [Cunninghamella echinulata]
MSKPIPQLALNGIYVCPNCNLQQDQVPTRFHSNSRASLYNSTCQNHSYTFDNADYGNNRSKDFPFYDHKLRHYHSANKLHQRYATSMGNNYDPLASSFSSSFPSSSFYQEEMSRNQERNINQHHHYYYHYYCYPPYNVFDSLDNRNEEKNMEAPSNSSCSTTFYDKPHQYPSNISGTLSVEEEERLEELEKIQTQGNDAYYQQLQHSLLERVGNTGYDLDSSQEKRKKEKGRKRKWIRNFIMKIKNSKKD